MRRARTVSESLRFSSALAAQQTHTEDRAPPADPPPRPAGEVTHRRGGQQVRVPAEARPQYVFRPPSPSPLFPSPCRLLWPPYLCHLPLQPSLPQCLSSRLISFLVLYWLCLQGEENQRWNLMRVFNLAQQHLDIPVLLDAEEMIEFGPDPLAVKAYVSFFRDRHLVLGTY